MIITPHALTGAALATLTTSPIVAFLLGFGSHFILDLIPHLDPGTFINYRERHLPDDPPIKWPWWVGAIVIVDFIIVVLFLWTLRQNSNFNLMLIGALGGITVDIIDSNPFIFGLRKYPFFKQFHWVHYKFHFFIKPKYWYWGLIFEIIVTGGTVWYLLRFWS